MKTQLEQLGPGKYATPDRKITISVKLPDPNPDEEDRTAAEEDRWEERTGR